MILPTSLEMVDFFNQCTNFSFHTLQHISPQQVQTQTNLQHVNKTLFQLKPPTKRESFASYRLIAGLVQVGLGLKYNCRHMVDWQVC